MKKILLHFLLLQQGLRLTTYGQSSLTLSAVGGNALQHSSVIIAKSSEYVAYQFSDLNPVVGYGGVGQFPSSINLAGVTFMSVTWSAPIGYMYVVTPPPPANGNFTLQFGLSYGQPGQADSLGTITESSASFALVSGSEPGIWGGASVYSLTSGFGNGLSFSGSASIAPAPSGFAFTSFTVTAGFDGASPSGVLDVRQNPFSRDYPLLENSYNIMMYGGSHDPFRAYTGAPDPGALLTLQPLPTPEPTTASLLGLAAAVYLLKRKAKR